MKYHIKGPGYEVIIIITDRDITERYPENSEEVRRQLESDINLAFATLYCPMEDRMALRTIDMFALGLKEEYLKKRGTIDDVVTEKKDDEDPRNKPN